ncbi:MAG TPA: L-seryl-tRNA(Sec) selenium transferase [Candidatus Limnocylindrales bacterium]|nr:L-seryl-tRNA(Sec) selenium transferase [Candidatus Limnocylindrales bacterium]
MSKPETNAAANPLRRLPSVDALLQAEGSAGLAQRYGRAALTDALRGVLAGLRAQLAEGEIASVDSSDVLDATAAFLHAAFAPSLRPVINATGIILHTNLGRAPLSEAALAAVQGMGGYSTLEYDLASGKRGSRLVHAETLICAVTGAEAALVVNNNAAALVLLLSALARGKGVILSRGQLVEIGGGFRVPEVMEQSGAVLIEVGTTNRTRPADYERAITTHAGSAAPPVMLMRAHASNFKQIGFTESASMEALARIARRHHLLLVDDIGSGALLDTAPFGLDPEPKVQDSLAAGADLVAFSGDKLLGGPQSGILAGKKSLIDQLKRHPLARALRADKLCLAALAATLDHYRRGDALEKVPVWRMIAMPLDAIEARARAWAEALGGAVEIVASESMVGGGSLPGATLPTRVLTLTVLDADATASRLRATSLPVIARIKDGRLLFDPRTVLPDQDQALLTALREVRS